MGYDYSARAGDRKMPIPNAEAIEKRKQEVIDGLKGLGITFPEDWEIEIDVSPYLGYDIKYGTKLPDEKILWFSVYSAGYPTSWDYWIKNSLAEIAAHFIEKGIA